MQGPHHRKIELQSTADLSYLYANTVALSRQKLDLHFPPSASNGSDPMKERVQELVDEFINKTYTTATSSISINGIDTNTSLTQSSKHPSSEQLLSFLSTRESIEYEPFDAALAGRLTSLYAQLESLTTTVAQMRRDAPAKAAREYAEALKGALAEDEGLDADEDEDKEEGHEGDNATTGETNGDDVDMKNHAGPERNEQRISRGKKQDWKLKVDFGSEREQERWREGEMSEVYADALKTLVRLQGEADDSGDVDEDGGRGLATTVGRVERARTAAGVVENM